MFLKEREMDQLEVRRFTCSASPSGDTLLEAVVTGVLDTIIPALLMLAVGIALADWRKGLLACIAVGFVQDPLRKLWPGEPVYLTALVGVVFAAAALGAAFLGSCSPSGERSNAAASGGPSQRSAWWWWDRLVGRSLSTRV